jgi:hypothetical protein
MKGHEDKDGLKTARGRFEIASALETSHVGSTEDLCHPPRPSVDFSTPDGIGGAMRLRSIIVSVTTVGMIVRPALAHGVLGSVAGREEGLHDHGNRCR